MAGRKEAWNLAELIDFELALHQGAEGPPRVAKEVREGLRERDFGKDETAKRRWGLKRWLESLSGQARGMGDKVMATSRFIGGALFVLLFLSGVGLVRGLSGEINGTDLHGFNIWMFLAVTVGVQWLILLGGIFSYFVLQRLSGGMGWLRELLASGMRRFLSSMDNETWRALTSRQAGQRGALAWRLARVLQWGAVGFNVGMLVGLFGMLWFTSVTSYWESTLPQFGAESLANTTHVLSLRVVDPGMDGVLAAQRTDDFQRPEVKPPWEMFFLFTLFVWGLLPRLILWALAIWKERQALRALDFQDLEHRKLWRQLTKVERTVVIEGPSDGVVLLDVGGLNIEREQLRPFLLQVLRVNPEVSYSISVLDKAEEQEAWAAMKKAPCGVILLVESWSLSPKQMTALISRLRNEAGEETVLRILVMGDGLAAPEAEEFAQWQTFADGLRDARLECVAYEHTQLA